MQTHRADTTNRIDLVAGIFHWHKHAASPFRVRRRHHGDAVDLLRVRKVRLFDTAAAAAARTMKLRTPFSTARRAAADSTNCMSRGSLHAWPRWRSGKPAQCG